MKIYRLIFTLLAGLLLSQSVSAQTILTGIVRDKGTNQPLVGANVYIINANNRTIDGYIVDANGEYRIRVPEETQGLKVVFSFVGYVTETVPYTGQVRINMNLAEDAYTVEAVNVTARRVIRDTKSGLTRRETTYASEKLSLEHLESAPVTSVTEALQGAFSNVDIISGGDPGANSSITIRGTSSLNSSSAPLIVLDGIPFPVEIESSFNFATADAEDYGTLLNISPADIQEVEVLKDAAATALYGSRASNGALLIKTKRGEKGRLQFTINSKYEFKKEASTIPLLNASQYISMVQDAIWNSVNDVGYSSSKGQEYLKLLFDTQEIGTFPEWQYYNEYNQDVKWIDYVTRPSFDLDNSIAISGGGEKTNYSLSIGYLTNQGTTEGTSYDRFSTAFNMGYRFSDKLDISTDFRFTYGNKLSNWSADKVKTPRAEAMYKMPNMSPYTIDPETLRMTDEYFTPYENFQGSFNDNKRYNPVASVNEAYSRTIENFNRINFNLHYNVLSGLDYYGSVSMEIRTNKPTSYVPQSVTGVTWTDDSFNKSSDKLSDQLYLYTENRLVYIKNFNENHRIISNVNFTTADQTKNEFGSAVVGNTSNYIVDPTSGGKIVEMKTSKSVLRSITALANVTYTFKNRYTLTAGYRQEANSNVGNNNRWKGFGTFGVNWVFSDEKWFANQEVFTFGKLRFNWGQSGNAPGKVLPYYGTFAPNGQYIYINGIGPSKIHLNKLDYETLTQSNLGIDLEFWHGKVQLFFEVYDKTTTDLHQKDVKLPSSTGFTQIDYFNSGKLSNKGWDFRIDLDPVRDRNWSIRASFNISQNFNELKELPSNIQADDFTFGNGNYAHRIVEGDPLGSFYGFKYLGVYKNELDTYMKDPQGNIVNNIHGEPVVMQNGSRKVYAGDAKYMDVNNDGKINEYDVVYLGNSYPTMNYGFNINLTYKNWALISQFHGRAGQKAVNSARMDLEMMRNTGNQSVAVLRRWRNESDVTDMPRALYDQGYNSLGSDRYVENASFLRMKRLTLQYKFPKEWMNKLNLQSLSMYVTAYDLWTITKYTGQDPEVGMDKSETYPLAKDGAQTPKPFRIAAGFTLKF